MHIISCEALEKALRPKKGLWRINGRRKIYNKTLPPLIPVPYINEHLKGPVEAYSAEGKGKTENGYGEVQSFPSQSNHYSSTSFEDLLKEVFVESISIGISLL